MGNKKKTLIIATSILVGSLAIGGTSYAVVKSQQEQKLDDARIEIRYQQESLSTIQSKLSGFFDGDGFIAEDVTLSNVKTLMSELNEVKHAYVDFGIKKDELTDEIKVVKVDKQQLNKQFELALAKVKLQDSVNNLFETPSLIGSRALEQPIKKGLSAEEVETVLSSVSDFTSEESEWFNSVKDLANKAKAQFDSVTATQTALAEVITDGVVKEDVSRDVYNRVKTKVSSVQNKEVKTELESSLAKILETIIAREKKEEELRKVEEQRQAEIQAKQQQQSQSTSSNLKSSSSSQKATGSSNYSNNSKSSNGGSKSTRSSSSNKSSNGGSNELAGSREGTISNVKKTGEGYIDVEGNGSESNYEGHGTYERGTFEWNPNNN